MQSLDDLDPRFATVICDIWGVIHDGGKLFDGVRERLLRWTDEGRTVILATNAPRPASTVESELLSFGLPRTAWSAVTSSGEAGIAALTDPVRPVGFLGTEDDLEDLLAHGVDVVAEGFTEIAAAGLRDWHDQLDDYRGELAEWRRRDVLFHCLNPDRVVVHLGDRLVCPGALADTYEAMGGRVAWYGKPFAPIYDHALQLAGDPALDRVVAVGDGLQTDMLGAARRGIAAIFITGGIHDGDDFPADFAERNGLGDWRPLACLPSIA